MFNYVFSRYGKLVAIMLAPSLLFSCSRILTPDQTSEVTEVRAGQYVLDPNHVTFFIEAGVQRGWIGYFAGTSRAISLDRFGESAPGAVVAEKLGLSVSNVVAQVERYFS